MIRNVKTDNVRVLYSFPHRLGADRICTTAWQQVDGVTTAGADVTACTGSVARQVQPAVRAIQTLAIGRIRAPYRLIGRMRALEVHDYIVARQLEKMAGQIDIVHAWPMGSLRTLRTAKALGIPSVLERPNAHTEFAYEVVRKECDRLGLTLPDKHEHAYKEDVLKREKLEYSVATKLLCPSNFVAKTFLERGFASEQLARHQYGYDERVFYPDSGARRQDGGLRIIFVGGCAPRKGLHYALDAWLESTACCEGEFIIAGEFVPGYAELLSRQLAHPSVRVLGHRTDIPELMRSSDILVLPTIEEGSALVTAEARGSGCVLLVSEASGAMCTHMENALVHNVGDVQTLAQHMSILSHDRMLYEKIREASLRTVHEITWKAAGRKLLDVYRQTIDLGASKSPRASAINVPTLA